MLDSFSVVKENKEVDPHWIYQCYNSLKDRLAIELTWDTI
jgi:hypothetical protein